MEKRILVVEDNLVVANMMTQILKKDGVDHLLVTSVRSALEMAEIEEFNVLLTDLGLPEHWKDPKNVDPFAGFQLAKNICVMIPGIRVIFCTGKGADEFHEKLPVGLLSVGFLQKPFGIKDLRRSLMPRKMAAVVAIASPEKKAEAIRELEKEGYVVHVPFENSPDGLAAEILRRELMPMYDEVVIRTS